MGAIMHMGLPTWLSQLAKQETVYVQHELWA
jgi:hypothetical protein